MEDKPMNLRAIADGYCRNIETLENELTELARQSAELVREVEADKVQRETTAANLEALRRNYAALESEKATIRAEFAEAQLENSTNAMAALRKRNKQVAAELEEIEQQMDAAGTVEANDLAVRCARLQVAKDAIKKRLPAQHYNTAANQHELVEAVRDVLHADAKRLLKMWNSIAVPAIYSPDTIKRVRAGTGKTRKVDPAYVERMRREREERKKRDRKERIEKEAGSVSHTGATVNEAGVLDGDSIRAALAAKQ